MCIFSSLAKIQPAFIHKKDPLMQRFCWFVIFVLFAILFSVLEGMLQPAWAGENVWTNIGPLGGNISHLIIDPSTPEIMYASVGTEIYKSTDAGNNWHLLPANIELWDIDTLIIDPVTPSTLYMANVPRIYKSINGGESWLTINTDEIFNVSFLMIAPTAPFPLYAISRQSIYTSVDGGTTWELTGDISLGNNSDNIVWAFMIDPQDSDTLYAGTGDGVLKSVDGGATWKLHSTGIPDDSSVTALAIHPTNPNLLFAGVQNRGIFKSIDGGIQWYPATIGITSNSIHAIVIDKNKPAIVYTGTVQGIFKSIDSGETWNEISNELPLPDIKPSINTIAIHPITSDTIYVGTSSGVYKSTNGGDNWIPKNQGISSSPIATLSIDPQSPSNLYIGTLPSGVMMSRNGGVIWEYAKSDPIWAWPHQLSIDPHIPSTIYAATNNGRFKSTNSGNSWVFLESCSLSCWLPHYTSIVVDPLTPNTVYAGSTGTWFTYGGVLKSIDGGDTWRGVVSGISGITNVSFITIDPHTPSTLYVGVSSGLYKSIDGAENWEAINVGLTTNTINTLAVDPTNPNRLLAGTVVGLFISNDGGKVWVPLDIDDRSTGITSVAIDPRTPTTMFVGRRDGIFRSLDSGGSWQNYNTGIRNPEITVLAFHPEDPSTLYAGTGTSGLYVLQNTAGPSIVTQPTAQTISRSESATLQVEARADSILSYQWYEGESGNTARPITDATKAKVFVGPLTQNSHFWVRITNAAGDSIGSDTVEVTVVADFQMEGPSAVAENKQFQITVTALDSNGKIAPGYQGRIRFYSSDIHAILPNEYTFATGDLGRHTFDITLSMIGDQTIEIKDVRFFAPSQIFRIWRIHVAAPVTHFSLTKPVQVLENISFPLKIVPVYANNAPAIDYKGTISFESSDPLAILPSNYTFQLEDHGEHTFEVIFATAGNQTLRISEVNDPTVTTETKVMVLEVTSVIYLPLVQHVAN